MVFGVIANEDQKPESRNRKQKQKAESKKQKAESRKFQNLARQTKGRRAVSTFHDRPKVVR